MNQRISIPVINDLEFINLQPMDINPLMSKCEVKVFYIGQNRNNSAITREVATNMAKTLRGCPIVGQYIENKEDFGDHGDQMVIDGQGVHFNTLTKPYGFVAPDAKVWFQFFEDEDEFGNTCLREYLVAEGYLWTEQFPEVKRVIENKNPQSMELDENTLQGHWANDNNSNIEFFIIDDAIISKLCILGEDVEPCFEGAAFSEPTISSAFSKDNDFMKELYTMVKELKFALNSEGGLSMQEIEESVAETAVEEPVVETAENEVTEKTEIENSSSEQDNSNEFSTEENENIVEEFAKEEEQKDTEEEPASQEDDEEEKEEKKDVSKNSLEQEQIDVEKLQNDFSELQNKYALLEEQNKELLMFKENVENEKKDELIKSFYMLSDEDKKNVIENKANYSLDDIEKELSVICVRKKVDFNLMDDSSNKKETTPAAIFNLDGCQAEELPAWLKVVDDVKNRNN